jgi:hypothetical protein
MRAAAFAPCLGRSAATLAEHAKTLGLDDPSKRAQAFVVVGRVEVSFLAADSPNDGEATST